METSTEPGADSVRDIESALADALGPKAALSKSMVSTICQAVIIEYDTWCRRDLSAIELDYLFLDASHFKMHDGQRAEPVLAAWGITTDGKPLFVGLAPAAAESTDAWHDFLTGLAGRGLRPPLLIHLRRRPRPARRRRADLRSVPAPKVRHPPSQKRAGEGQFRRPGRGQTDLLADFQPGRSRRGITPGQHLVDGVQRRIDAFVEAWGGRYPAAVKGLLTDCHSLITYLRFPPEHHERICPSTLLSVPSVRPAAAGSRSSAASPARSVASASCGPSWTALPAAGDASPSSGLVPRPALLGLGDRLGPSTPQ
ncbi:hypothetical protein GCM10022252_64880 [Streptosporangium oxazolinicum]|uniref:Mutator family transposase n=1 Tax=Streptosporangium oxazolinicum TaxID=909287 RepID=A0ABP8BEG7_9ACTN